MFRRILPKKWHKYRWLISIGDWSLLFLMLLLAIYLATQRRDAPQLILIFLLYIITVNFSLPLMVGGVGLVPLVAVSSLLVMELETAVSLAAVSLLLAELARPMWAPMWENINVRRPGWKQRFGMAFTSLVATGVGGYVYRLVGGSVPDEIADTSNLLRFGALALSYILVYLSGVLLLWLMGKRPLRLFFSEHLLPLLLMGFLSQPFALFGGIIFALGGLPTFVIFSISIVFISIMIWFNWQRSYVLERRLNQFSTLNNIGMSLRETLNLEKVIEQIYSTMAQLIGAEHYTIVLINEEGDWYRPELIAKTKRQSGSAMWAVNLPLEASAKPDDFTNWVATNAKVLDLNSQNMHFAERHRLRPPFPLPGAWLGVPLVTAERVIGVLVLQRYPPGQPFSRWSREVLLAVAGQASAAIQNARLYSETLRLYNLTDEALAQRLKQLSALLNTMQDGVLMVDVNGRIILVNAVAANLLRQPASKLQGQQLIAETAAAPLGYDQEELAGLLMLLKSHQLPQPVQITYVLQTHQTRKAQYWGRSEAPVVAENQQIFGWLMIFRDVTEEMELAERRTDLTRMIVHDLRNPVTTFISTMSLVDSMLPPDSGMEIVREVIGDAKLSSYDMLDMVDSLMDINRMEAGQLVVEVDAINLPELVEAVVQRLQILAKQRRINMTYEIGPDIPDAWIDDDMIRRVLVNLLDNGLKFTPGGGTVHCTLLAEPTESPKFDRGIRCIISDSGSGIPAEAKTEIFERFMRTNAGGAQVRGTGLGLAFCKLAVEAHNGRIWVEDKPGGGSQFIFTLPGIPILDM